MSTRKMFFPLISLISLTTFILLFTATTSSTASQSSSSISQTNVLQISPLQQQAHRTIQRNKIESNDFGSGCAKVTRGILSQLAIANQSQRQVRQQCAKELQVRERELRVGFKTLKGREREVRQANRAVEQQRVAVAAKERALKAKVREWKRMACKDASTLHGEVMGVCERCGRCKKGLICSQGVCQRRMGRKCAEGEICGVGERRVCQSFQGDEFEEVGMLKMELESEGYFVGVTEGIEGCDMGLVRFDCGMRERICGGGNFCLELTLGECEEKGLKLTEGVEGGIVVVRTEMEEEVRQVEGCCTLVVQRDCYRREVCKCVKV